MRLIVGLLILSASAAIAAGCSERPAVDRRTSEVGPPAAPATPEAGAGAPVAATATSPIALRVPDISCRLCAAPIEHHLREMGVQEVEVDVRSKWVTGRFDPARLTPAGIRAKIEGLRFRVTEVRVG